MEKQLLEEILHQIKDLRKTNDERFEKIDERFEQIDKRFEQIDGKFEEHDNKFKEINKRFDKLSEEIAEQFRYFAQYIDKKQNENFKILSDKIDMIDKRAQENLEKYKECVKKGIQEFAKAVS